MLTAIAKIYLQVCRKMESRYCSGVSVSAEGRGFRRGALRLFNSRFISNSHPAVIDTPLQFSTAKP